MASGQTFGDIAGPRVRAAGLLFFGDVGTEVREGLDAATKDQRRAFALRCAQRAMKWHRALPSEEQRSYTLSWEAVLDRIQAGLRGDVTADRDVSSSLEAFRSEDILREPSRDGDADEHAAATAIYAAECFQSGAVQPACWAADRLVEIAFGVADREVSATRERVGAFEEFIRSCEHPAVQAELRWQLDALSRLEP